MCVCARILVGFLPLFGCPCASSVCVWPKTAFDQLNHSLVVFWNNWQLQQSLSLSLIHNCCRNEQQTSCSAIFSSSSSSSSLLLNEHFLCCEWFSLLFDACFHSLNLLNVCANLLNPYSEFLSRREQSCSHSSLIQSVPLYILLDQKKKTLFYFLDN